MKNFKITQSITNRQDASLSIFFKEVSKLPMLSIEEEVELARRVKEGDNSAINKLVEANLRFVISVAKQYQNKGLALVDLIQEGVLGCTQAAKLYDETKGFRFISYAVWWIRQAIIKAISDQCRTVRIPMTQVNSMNKINKATSKLEQQLGRNPTIEELETETEIDSEKINITLLSTTRSLSFDTPFKNDEESGSLLDIIPDENLQDLDESLESETTYNIIESVLHKLSDREGDVVRMVFGIGMNPMTLEEISARFGIGSERIRQIQIGAIDKIKRCYKDDLKELL